MFKRGILTGFFLASDSVFDFVRDRNYKCNTSQQYVDSTMYLQSLCTVHTNINKLTLWTLCIVSHLLIFESSVRQKNGTVYIHLFFTHSSAVNLLFFFYTDRKKIFQKPELTTNICWNLKFRVEQRNYDWNIFWFPIRFLISFKIAITNAIPHSNM